MHLNRYDNILKKLAVTCTLYIGNLSFYTTEEQVHALFSRCGDIRRIIMGLNKETKTPCGFCFVEYFNHDDAADARRFLSGTKCDDRVICVEFDEGFEEGRQYGRGKNGGQVRDEYRPDYDSGRGGFNFRVQQEQTSEPASSAAPMADIPME